MQTAADDAAQADTPFLPPPLPIPPAGAAAPPAMPPVGAPPMPQAPAGPPPVPYQTRQQPDGSVIGFIPSPDGNPANEIIIGVHPALKVPKGLQPQPQAPMNGQPM